MKRIAFFLWIVLSVFFAHLAGAQETGDGIPDNCENVGAEYYQANLFPRYEPPASRVVLVDWSTGADVRELETGLVTTSFQVHGWSADCRYLAGAILNMAGDNDTVVWDAINGGRVGTIADAVGRPHTVTWGFAGYLVVETRNGALLWNVPLNSQVVLTTSWDAYTVRNFSRLRWDAAHNQLIVNLAVGGRIVFDLTTGLEVPVAANTTDSLPNNPSELGTIVVAGNTYPCQIGYVYGYRNWFSDNGYQIPGIYARYSITDNTIYLALDDPHYPDETLQVIEGNVDITWFEFRGWSANCRYFAAALGNADGTSDTAVFDIVENRRVGTFTGARDILHPLRWNTTGDALVITTREGGYLWYLPTDTRTLINPVVETAINGYSGITSFYRMYWDAQRGQLLTAQAGSGNVITVYDIRTGTQLGVYPSGGDEIPVNVFLSPDGSHMLVYGGTHGAVWNRDSGAQIASFSGFEFNGYGYNLAFSPDNRYLASYVYEYSGLSIWDLQHLNSNMTPNYIYSEFRSSDISFTTSTTLRNYYGEILDISTGVVTLGIGNTPLPTTTIAGVSGLSSSRNRDCSTIRADYNRELRQLEIQDSQTDDMLDVIETNLNSTGRLILSPDCRFVSAEVSVVSNANLPYDDAPLDDVDRDRRTEVVVVWNIASHQRVAEFANPYRWSTYSSVWWSPNSERAVVRTTDGHFVLNAETGEFALLVFEQPGTSYYSGPAINTYAQVYWDYARGQILISGWDAVYAFDMITGLERYRFTVYPDGRYGYYGRCDYGGCFFSVSPDNNTLFVRGFSGMGIWNLDTLAHQYVDVRGGTAYTNRAHLSPDGRYLVIARRNIRVWDLTALPEDSEEHDPMISFGGPEAPASITRFVDNTTIEITTFYGEVTYWDVTTGAQVDP